MVLSHPGIRPSHCGFAQSQYLNTSVFYPLCRISCDYPRIDVQVGQILLENRWNLDLVVAMLTRIEKDDMRCEACGVNFSGSVLNLVALLVETRPGWCKELVKGGGMGRYSMLTKEMLEELFNKLLVQGPELEVDNTGKAKMVVRITEGFPEWASMAEDMQNRLDRVKKEFVEESQGWFYGIYRPIEGLPFCLVPS